MSTDGVPKPPLSCRLMFVLCLCDGAHYYAICSLFSYAGIMSADMRWVEDRDQAGFVAGFLASASMIGRILTSSIYGSAAARYGYKRLLICILCSLILGGVCFGLSTNLPLALASRFLLLGCGNGWVTLVAPLALEVGGAERQTDVLGLIMGSGSFTQLFGPAVAGWTYNLVSAFPAAVPSMIGSIYALFTLLGVVLWMPGQIGIYSAVSSGQHMDGSGLKSNASKVSSCALVFQWPVGLIACMRFLHGVMTMGLMELAPLWLISTVQLGGLELSQQQVGALLARSAVWNMLYFSVIMPRGSKLMGIRCFAGVAGAAAACCCAALPFATGTVAANFLHMLACSTSISTGAMAAICTSNSVSPERRSEVAGTIVIFETVAKALGPIFTANVFAWTLSRWGRAGHGVVFFLLAALHVLYCLGAMCLPASVESPVVDASDTIQKVEEKKHALPAILGASKEDPSCIEEDEQNKLVDSLQSEELTMAGEQESP